MISADIDLDKLLDDIDQQIEVLTSIAADNLILNEQLRLLHAAKDALLGQEQEVGRLTELLDPDMELGLTNIIDLKSNLDP